MGSKFNINKQNTEYSLKLLTAQGHLYSRTKFIGYTGLILDVIPILLKFWVKNQNIIDFTVIIVTVLSIILAQYEKHKIKQAAKIQELFDIKIFGLPWNEILAGEKPNIELINKNSQKNKNMHYKDWYNNPKMDSENLNILICQRSNVSWNIELHKICRYSLGSLLFLLFVVCLFFIFLENRYLPALNKAVIVLLPLIVKCINLYIGFGTLQKNEKSLLSKIDKSIQTLDNIDSKWTLRNIQDYIFNNIRCSSILVPDWIHSLTKNKQEKANNEAMEGIKDILKEHLS